MAAQAAKGRVTRFDHRVSAQVGLGVDDRFVVQIWLTIKISDLGMASR